MVLDSTNPPDANAQFNWGLAYDTGEGTPMNKEYAAFWYAKAAEQGHPLSQGRLGHMYADGEGVPQSFERKENSLIYLYDKEWFLV